MKEKRAVSAMPLGRATLGVTHSHGFAPNWIDYRGSVANVDRRGDRGEQVEVCADCGCETDIVPVPHSPKCPVVSVAAGGNGHRSLEDGHELLDRMDAGESLDQEPPDEPAQEQAELEEAAAVGKRAESGSAPLLVGEPERAAVSSSSDHRYGLRKFGRGYIWTREAALAAVRDYLERMGRAPTLMDARREQVGQLPSQKSADQLFGGWPALLAAADGEAGESAKDGSSRAEALAPTSPERNTAARPASSEREPEAAEAADAGVAVVGADDAASSPVVPQRLAASRSDVLLRAFGLAARAFADAILEDAA